MSTPPPVAETVASAAAPASVRQGEPGRREHRERGYSPFLPLSLLVVTAVASQAFQCYQFVNEKQALATLFGNQTRQVEDAGKLRNALEALARETALLAANGNPSAKLIVDELARRGVTINPGAQPGAPAKAGN